MQVSVHFYDEDRRNVDALREHVRTYAEQIPSVLVDVQPWAFELSLEAAREVLRRPTAAKLVLIDQYGVDYVSDSVFRELVECPTCDLLFFISSSTLNRFHGHPAIKQRIRRPDDYYHVHRAVADYYRALLPSGLRYFLGRFSIKKSSNIYGVIFGSAHPLGMDKFLRVAWQTDKVNGEADFDIDRDDCGPLLSALLPPTKLTAFESDLESRIRSGSVRNEAQVIDICFQHGVRRQHAERLLKQLKADGVIRCDFRVPDIGRIRDPRQIGLSKA